MINKDFFEGLLGRLKIFWTSLILVFFVVSLQMLGMQGPNLLPIVSTKIQTFFHPTHISYTTPLKTHADAVTIKKGGE